VKKNSSLLISEKKPFIFYPPKNNQFIIRFAKYLLPAIMRIYPKVSSVEVSEEDLERLKELKDQRVIIVPNHPEGIEPCILFHLSKILNKEFNFLAAKEAFERAPSVGKMFKWVGLYPWLLQRLGAYSIIRGTADRSSFRMTRQLLVEGKRWLIIFPEGEVCFQCDTVMPFQQGIAHLAFMACEDLSRYGGNSPLYLVPVAIKYIYLRDMRQEIAESLNKLESELIPSGSTQSLNLYERLRRVCEFILSVNEKEYNVHPGKDTLLNDRFQYMKELIVSRVETALGCPPQSDQPFFERMRSLFNAIDQIIYYAPEDEYSRQLHRSRQQEVQKLYNDLSRIHHFIALYDGYVKEMMSTERFLDVINRLEMEVYGKIKFFGPRKAVLRIGKPLNIQNDFQRYKSDKKGTIKEITVTLEASVQSLLSDLGRLTKPIKTV